MRRPTSRQFGILALFLGSSLASATAHAGDLVTAPGPAPPAVAAPARSPVKVSGYLQVQYTDTADAEAVHLRRVRVRLRGDVVSGVSYTVMFDPSTPANLLRDAFIALGFVPRLELRLGQQKTQFGYENPESSTRLYPVNRAFVSDQLGRGPDLRDLGIGALGAWPVGAGVGVEVAATLVGGAGPNVTKDDVDGMNLWSRAGVVYRHDGLALAVRIGGSLATGDHLDKGADPADPADDVTVGFVRYGADLTLDSRWAFFAAEVIQGDHDATGAERRARGAYVLLVGKTPWRVGPMVRWDEYDPDSGVDGDRRRRYTLGACYDLSGIDARLTVNVEIDDSQTHRPNVFYLFAQALF